MAAVSEELYAAVWLSPSHPQTDRPLQCSTQAPVRSDELTAFSVLLGRNPHTDL